jgi:hypothetical protein
MRPIVFLFSVVILTVAAQPVTVVDLTGPPADFPTNRVSASVCGPAFDSGLREPLPSCMPFPIKLEVKRDRAVASQEGNWALEIAITNESDQTIDLPVSPRERRKGGKEQFIALAIYSPPLSKRAISIAYAFADAKDASSVAALGPGQSIVYLIPFDKKALKLRADNDASKTQITVELVAYSVTRGPNSSDDVSARRGNRIVSRPFTISD